MKRAPGIPKFLPLDTVTHASNGFLISDCCVFGAEILVVKGAHNIRACDSSPEILVKVGPGEKPCAASWSYTWRINYFSQLKTSYYSPIFRIGEWYWYVYYDICFSAFNFYVKLITLIVNDNDII